jgi:hypothetical protein
MTPPTKILDAARTLGAKPSEIASVESVDGGVLVEMVVGSPYLIAADGSVSAYVAPVDEPEVADGLEAEPVEPVEPVEADPEPEPAEVVEPVKAPAKSRGRK